MNVLSTYVNSCHVPRHMGILRLCISHSTVQICCNCCARKSCNCHSTNIDNVTQCISQYKSNIYTAMYITTQRCQALYYPWHCISAELYLSTWCILSNTLKHEAKLPSILDKPYYWDHAEIREFWNCPVDITNGAHVLVY